MVEHHDRLVFSLHFNTQSTMYSVMPERLRTTLVGTVFMVLDCFLKGFLNGGTFTPEFLLAWHRNPTTNKAQLLPNVVDIRRELRRHNVQVAPSRSMLC
jgi:hypothetical protein